MTENFSDFAKQLISHFLGLGPRPYIILLYPLAVEEFCAATENDTGPMMSKWPCSIGVIFQEDVQLAQPL